jgi:hypothetical protein
MEKEKRLLQLIFLLNVNFIIKIADNKKKSKNSIINNSMVGMGRMGPNSRLHNNQPHH